MVLQRCAFVSVFLSLLVVHCAVADTETSLGDRSGEGTTAFTGLAQSPEANLFTGALSTHVSIKVPPGRKHMTPKLMLTYSSSGGPSPYGKGWDLELGHIERSTRWGVPNCDNPHFDEFVLILPSGVAAELVEEGTNKYRPRVEQAYTYAEYHPGTNKWTARDAAGIKYEFGTTPDSKLGTVLGNPPLEQMNGDQCDFTTAWALTKMEDSNGNTIEITWLDKAFSGNFLLPVQINYGGNSATSLAHFHTVDFDWLDASTVPPSTTYRRGVEQTLSVRLGSIRPSTTKSPGGLPQYVFEGSGLGARYLLKMVSAPGDLPTQNFFYSDWDGDGHFASPVTVNAPSSPEPFNRLRKWSQTTDVFKTLIDMNGDGLLDLVDDSPLGQPWNVYFSTLSDDPNTLLEFGPATPWSAPWDLVRAVLQSGCSGYGVELCTARDTFDITGDGIPDYVNAHSTPWIVHPGRYNGGWGFEATGQSWPAQHEFTRMLDHEDIYQDVIDMTGDGLPDLVKSGPSGVPIGKWLVYRNTGAGFDSTPMHFPVPDPDITQITRANEGRTQTMLTDFNGDGLPDLLTTMGYDPTDPMTQNGNNFYFPSQFHVYLNTGQAFSDNPVLLDGALFGLLPASDDKHTYADILDMNGDGLPDLVQNFQETEWRVFLNIGGDLEEREWFPASGAPNQYYSRSPRVWPGLTDDIRWSENERQNIDMIDMNGDGFLDRVRAIGTTSWQVQLNKQTVKPDLLVMMENGLGGTNTIKYEPSSRFDHVDLSGAPTLPFISWVVTGTRLNDGTCILLPGRDPFETDVGETNHNNCIAAGSELITKMHYEGGLFAYEPGAGGSIIREFRGFRAVTQTDVFGNETITVFEQGRHTKGLVSSVYYLVGDASLVRLEVNDWDTAPFGGGSSRTQLWLASNLRHQYDGGATPLAITMVNDRPDPFGNVTHTYTYGTNIPYEIHSKTEFIDPGATSAAPRDKPKWTYTWEDFNGNDAVNSLGAPDQYGRTTELLEEKKFYYDTQGYGTILKGDLTKVSSRLLVDGQSDVWVDTGTTYDAYGNVATAVDGNGRTAASLIYNTDGKGAFLYPTLEINALQHVTIKDYDYRHGKVTKHQGPNDEIETAEYFGYDKLGRIVLHMRPGDVSLANASVSYTYTFPTVTPGQAAAPSVVTVATKQDDHANNRWVSTYFDALGRQRYQDRPQVVNGSLATVRSNNVRFDYGGNVALQYQPHPPGAPGAYTQYDYHFNGDADLIDPLGRVHRVVAPSGDVVTTVYGAAGTHTIGALGEFNSSFRDALGRDVRRTNFHRPPPTGAFAVHSTSETIYDGLGRTVAVYQNRATADIPMKKVRYDTLGRKISIHDRDSGTWTYGYDEVGNLLWQEDPKADQHMQFCYDDLDRPVHKCSIGEDRTTFSAYVACVGTSTQSCYAGGIDVHYEYDDPAVPNSVGRSTRTLDEAGETRVLGYDDRGRQTGVVRRIVNGTDVGEAEFGFTYNRTDEIVEIEYPGGEIVQTHYNASGQPKSLCNSNGFFYVADARYDLFGRLTKLDRMVDTASGLAALTDRVTFYESDKNYRLKEISLANGANGTSVPFHRQQYGQNARGQITSITDFTNASNTERNTTAGYSYDDLGQLVEWNPFPTTLPTREYKHDKWGNITQKGNVLLEYPDPTVAASKPHQTNLVKLGSTSYGSTHDANGNREKSFASGALTSDAILYDAENRISRIGLSVTESVSFVYDAGGQQKIKIFDDGMGEDVTKYYSQFVEVRPGGSTLKSYFFGGTRIATLVEDDSSWQLDYQTAGTWQSPVQFATQWGGAPVMLVSLSQTAVTVAGWGTALLFVTLFVMPPGRRRRAVVGMRLGRGPAVLLSVLVFTGTMPWPILIQPAEAACMGCDCPPPVPPPAEDLSYYHYDHLGSPLLITNGAGEVVEQIRYDPYGTVRGRYNGAGAAIVNPPATDVRYEFTGYEAERNSGLLYANARFFDTELGSFLTHDPMAEFWSPYTYVGWDPVNGTDPTGECEVVCWGIIVGAVVGFAVGAIQAAANGASFGEALLAGAISGAIGGVTGGVLGPIGAAAFEAGGWVLGAYLAVTLSYGAYGVYSGFEAGQNFAAAVGVVFLAMGVYSAAKVAGRALASTVPISQGEQLTIAEIEYGQKFGGAQSGSSTPTPNPPTPKVINANFPDPSPPGVSAHTGKAGRLPGIVVEGMNSYLRSQGNPGAASLYSKARDMLGPFATGRSVGGMLITETGAPSLGVPGAARSLTFPVSSDFAAVYSSTSTHRWVLIDVPGALPQGAVMAPVITAPGQIGWNAPVTVHNSRVFH